MTWLVVEAAKVTGVFRQARVKANVKNKGLRVRGEIIVL
jgi:hypothetical protein